MDFSNIMKKYGSISNHFELSKVRNLNKAFTGNALNTFRLFMQEIHIEIGYGIYRNPFP